MTDTTMQNAWRIVSPAPATAALALAGPWPSVRRRVLAQVRTHQSAAIFLGMDLMAVAMFGPYDAKRLEMALAIEPAAARHMRRLVRMAHLTLAAIAQSQSIVAAVRPGHLPGERMARATGFRPVQHTGLWIFRKRRCEHESIDGRQQQGSGTSAARAEGRKRSPAGGTEIAGTEVGCYPPQPARPPAVHERPKVEPGLIAADD